MDFAKGFRICGNPLPSSPRHPKGHPVVICLQSNELQKSPELPRDFEAFLAESMIEGPSTMQPSRGVASDNPGALRGPGSAPGYPGCLSLRRRESRLPHYDDDDDGSRCCSSATATAVVALYTKSA